MVEDYLEHGMARLALAFEEIVYFKLHCIIISLNIPLPPHHPLSLFLCIGLSLCLPLIVI